MLIVKEQDSGKSATIAPGDTLLVTLSTTPGTGYGWRVTDVSCLRQTADPQIEAAPSGLVGAPQNETFAFEATAAPCIGMVKLDYVRPWEKDESPAKTFGLKIAVR
jgi:predicted secreted protein